MHCITQITLHLKKETIPIVLAIIGLLADTIAIFTFIGSANAQQSLDIEVNATIVVSVAQVIIIYVWIVAAWYICRKIYEIKYANKGRHPKQNTLREAVIGIGLVLAPFHFMFELVFKDYIAIGTVWFIITGSIFTYVTTKVLFLLFYDDMHFFLDKTGKYICIKKIKGEEGSVVFDEGNIIEITSRTIHEGVLLIPMFGWVLYLTEWNTFNGIDENGDDLHMPISLNVLRKYFKPI